MSNALELYDSRVSYIRFTAEGAEVHFSFAYIYQAKGAPGRDPGSAWSQEAILYLESPQAVDPLPPLPNTIRDGYLENGGRRYEMIPLPFERKTPGRLHLEFADGSVLEVKGEHPLIKLVGEKVFLEDFN